MKKNNNKTKAGRYTPFLVLLVIAGMLWAIGSSVYLPNQIDDKSDNSLLDLVFKPDVETKWVLVDTVKLDTLGDYDPGAGSSGWLETFILDYGENPDTVLANNATDWSSEATARGYIDSDNAETDLEANNPGYFVVGCRFNNSAKNGTIWDYDRFRVNLTVGGSETISDRGELDNSTNDASNSGDAVVSATHANWIYIYFYWDDNNDGYSISSDGTLTWSISIYEKR